MSSPVVIYAIEVHTDWNPASVSNKPQIKTSNPFVAVRQGMQGYSGPAEQGYVLINIPSVSPPIKGWVPQTVLHRGHEKRNPLPIEIFTPSNQPSLVQGPATLPGENVSGLRRALRSVWAGIAQNQQAIIEMIPGLAQKARQILFGPGAATYADTIYNCVHPPVREVLEKPNFTVNDLLQLEAVSSKWPRKGSTGIYIIIYYDIDDHYVGGVKVVVGIYIGLTTDFYKRYGKHRQQPGGAKSNHYRVAGKSRRHLMIPIMFADFSHLPENFLDIAELTFVCLFGSWYPDLFTPTNAKLHGAYGLEFEAAGVFSRIAKQSIQASGWVAPQMTGLNWLTPIIRNYTEINRWVSWYEASKDMWVYRTSRSLVVGGHATVRLGGGVRINIQSELVKAAGFKNGQPVQLVVERSTRGPHPFRLVRLPTVGLNPEVERLQHLAVRLEWADEFGHWWTAYICRAKMWQATNEDAEALAIYQLGMAIYMDLSQTRYINAPEWVHVRPETDIRQMTKDHLNQKLQVTKLQGQVRPWPQNNTLNVNGNRLRAMFPQQDHPHLRIGDRPGTMKLNRKCDICYSERGTNACGFNPATGTCDTCKFLNRPCTFTDVDDFLERAKQNTGDLEELAIPINPNREGIAYPRQLPAAPFDPKFEDEEHMQTLAD